MKKKEQKKSFANPVAKFAHQSNRCTAFEDRTKYNRKEKHKDNSRHKDGYYV